MDEYEIATRNVLPYLEHVLKWPPSLVRGYGRVPVQVGTSTRWADFLCYIVQGNKLYPYLLVEVKQEGLNLEQMIPQAESYSLILGAPFFCVTDGNKLVKLPSEGCCIWSSDGSYYQIGAGKCIISTKSETFVADC